MASDPPPPAGLLPGLGEFYRFLGATRQEYLEFFGRVPWPVLTKEVGGTLGSIRNIYLHILQGYSYWFDFVPAERSGEFVDWEGRFEEWDSLESLRVATRDTEGRIRRFLEGLTPPDLGRSLVVDGKEGRSFVRVDTMLYHMIEEELQHRGEINSVFALQAVPPPQIGYVRWRETHPPVPALRGPARRRGPGRH